MKKICNFITNNMGILVLLAAVFSLFAPQVLGAIETSAINPLLGVIMFGMGLPSRPKISG
jgi:BASS family bile acid:Na+ symporter